MGGGASPSAASPRRGRRGPAAEAAVPGPAEGGDSPRTEARKARAAKEWAVAPGARGLSQVLRKWDKGGREHRMRMLKGFVERHEGGMGVQLERIYGNGASLFLTRVLAWMRLTYMPGTGSILQLQTINVFLRSANGTRYLVEFLEAGGLLTVLHIINVPEVEEEVKYFAFQVLQCVVAAGRQYKELICKQNGVSALLTNLVATRANKLQHIIYDLLLSLGTGNSQYAIYIVELVVHVLNSDNPGAARLASLATKKLMVAASLRSNNLEMLLKKATEGAATMLSSQEPAVQHEAVELLTDLRQYEGTDTLIVEALTDLVLPHEMFDDGYAANPDDTGGPFGAQAAAARMLGLMAPSLCRRSAELHNLVTSPRVVGHLLGALTNDNHYESKKQVASALLVLVDSSDSTRATIFELGFQKFYEHFIVYPNTLYKAIEEKYYKDLRELAMIIAGFELPEFEEEEEEGGPDAAAEAAEGAGEGAGDGEAPAEEEAADGAAKGDGEADLG